MIWQVCRILAGGRELPICGEIFYDLEEAKARVEELDEENYGYGDYHVVRELKELNK